MDEDQYRSLRFSGYDSIDKKHSSNKSSNFPTKFQDASSNDIIKMRNLIFGKDKIEGEHTNSV